ncbi:peptidoglycan-binding protein [Streptomyces sp. NPDC035033]|uniref:peptidoglycan-binding domain-containing protein n=1 Tax=Streptomyces sp. NPDC035033 TaxID=3155368 RepID=UPI0033C7ACDF
MNGHACPECGGQRPGCACARAAERAAETAAAEDFDPLRIRPYVTLDAQDDGGPGAGAGDAGDPPTAQLTAIRPGVVPEAGAGAYEARTQVIPAYGAGPQGYDSAAHDPAPYGSAPYGSPSHDAAPYGSAPHDPARSAPDGSAPYGSAPYGSGDGVHETMPLLLGGVGGAGGDGAGPRRGERPSKRRGALVACVAAAAVVGTAALAAAVLGGEETDDRATVPEVTTSASLNIAVSESPSPTSSASAAPTPTRTPSRTPSSPPPSPTATPSTASPSASAEPTARPAATGSPSASGGAAPSASPSAPPAVSASPTTASPAPTRTSEGVVLTLGDTGAEVRELQLRLTAIYVYRGDIDGVYSEEVRDAVASYQGWLWPRKDPEGVYGAYTRRNLERLTADITG